MAVKVTVYGTADMRQIQNARTELDKLEASARANEGGFSAAMTRMGTSLQNVGEKMTAVGGTMTRNVTVPLAALGAGLYLAAENAAKDAQAQVILAGALRNNAGATDAVVASTEEWISAQGKLLGVTDDQLRPALATLVGATKDVGKAQELATLAMDVAAARGVDVETAAKAIGKAYAGQTSQLTKLVPGIDAAAVASGDFAAIQASVAGIVGGQAANAADTLAGRMQRMKVRLDEAKEALGSAFAPVMENVVNLLSNRFVPAVEKLAEFMGKIPAPVLTTAVAFGAALAAAGPLLMVLGNLVTSVGALLPVIAKIVGAFSGPVGWILLAVGAIATLIATNDELRQSFVGIFEQLSSTLLPVFKELWTALQPVIQSLGQAFTAVIAALVPVIGDLLTAITPLIVAIGTTLASVVQGFVDSGILQTLTDVIMKVVEAVTPLIEQIGTVLANAVQTIIDSGILTMLSDALIQIFAAITPLIPVIGELVMAFIPLLKPIIELIDQLLPPLVELLRTILPPAIAIAVGALKIIIDIVVKLIGVITEVVSHIVAFVATAIEHIGRFAADVIKNITTVVNWFGELPKRIGDALSGAASWLVNTGRDIVEGLWNGIKGGWTWLTDQLGKLVNGLVGGVKDMLGIKSPSRVFMSIGQDLGLGFANGIDAMERAVSSAAFGLAQAASMTAAQNVSVNAAGFGASYAAQPAYAMAAPSSSVSSRTSNISIAPGAVQVTVSGTDGTTAQAAVEDAFAQLIRELRAS